MAKPMFFYTGVYDNVADADADYEAIKSLHKGGAIGSYDSAVIVHTPDGDVKVTKTEKPTQKGGWIGLAAGAGVAVVFPFLLPAVSYAGMAAGGRRARRVVRAPGSRDEPRRGQGHRCDAGAGQGRADRRRHRQGRRADRARARRAPSSTCSSATSVTGMRPSRRRSPRWSARRPSRSADRLRRGRRRRRPPGPVGRASPLPGRSGEAVAADAISGPACRVRR